MCQRKCTFGTHWEWEVDKADCQRASANSILYDCFHFPGRSAAFVEHDWAELIVCVDLLQWENSKTEEVKSVSEIHFCNLHMSKKKKKCLLLLFLFSDRLWIDSVTLALIAWIFYAVARSYWICSDSCYSNIGYVGYDAPMLIWGIALWSLFIHLGQFLHKSRQTEQLHHSDFNSELLLIHLVKLRQKVFTISLGIPLPVSYHLAAIIPGSNCCWLDLKVPGENKEETQRATASIEAPEGLAQHSIA